MTLYEIYHILTALKVWRKAAVVFLEHGLYEVSSKNGIYHIVNEAKSKKHSTL